MAHAAKRKKRTGNTPKQIAIAERRLQVVQLLSRGLSHAEIAATLGVARSTIVTDVSAIKEVWGRTVADSDPNSEAGGVLSSFDMLASEALIHFDMASKDSVKVSYLNSAIKALGLKARFMIDTGLVPRAPTTINGELKLSTGQDVSRMSLTELRALESDLRGKLRDVKVKVLPDGSEKDNGSKRLTQEGH